MKNDNKRDRLDDGNVCRRARLAATSRKCVKMHSRQVARDQSDDARDVSMGYEVLLACVHACEREDIVRECNFNWYCLVGRLKRTRAIYFPCDAFDLAGTRSSMENFHPGVAFPFG